MPPGAPPPERDDEQDWWPFQNRPHFEFTDWHFERVQTSQGNLNELLKNYAAQRVLETGNVHASAPYDSAQDMLDAIDAIPHGEAGWTTFDIKYTGPITPQTPLWKLKTYTIHTRNTLRVVENMAASPEFDGRWDYVPYEEYSKDGCRRYSDVMSGTWAFKKAVSTLVLHLHMLLMPHTVVPRPSLPRTRTTTGPCSRPSSLVPTKRPSPSPQATKSSTRYIYP